MMGVLVLNGKTDGWLNGEYVGRKIPRSPHDKLKRGSVLGNPFKVAAHNHAAHSAVVQKYKQWLWEKIRSGDTAICNELQRLKELAVQGELRLLCWCAPLPCHADVIKGAIGWATSAGVNFTDYIKHDSSTNQKNL